MDDRRFLADTKSAEGALLDVDVFMKELTVLWPGNIISSPMRVVHSRRKFGRGMVKSTFLDLGLQLTSKQNPPQLGVGGIFC